MNIDTLTAIALDAHAALFSPMTRDCTEEFVKCDGCDRLRWCAQVSDKQLCERCEKYHEEEE